MWPWFGMCSCLEGLWQPEDFFRFKHWKAGPQNCQDPQTGLQAEILSPALLLHSLCRQFSGSLEHAHGQVVSSSANVNEHLFS